MAITATLSGSVGAGVEFFEVYFDSPCYSGSDGGPVTGSTPGEAIIYSGSQLTQVGGVEVSFPDGAQVAYIRTLGEYQDPISNNFSGSQYCSHCFGPVAIPGAIAPSPTPTPTNTATPTVTPTNTPTPTPQPSSQVVLTPFKMYANYSSGTSEWVGLENASDYCSSNYTVSVTFYTNAPSFAALISTTGYVVYDNSSGTTTNFDGSDGTGTFNKFAAGTSTFSTQNVDEFRVLTLSTNGTVTGVNRVSCTQLPDGGGGGGQEQ